MSRPCAALLLCSEMARSYTGNIGFKSMEDVYEPKDFWSWMRVYDTWLEFNTGPV